MGFSIELFLAELEKMIKDRDEYDGNDIYVEYHSLCEYIESEIKYAKECGVITS